MNFLQSIAFYRRAISKEVGGAVIVACGDEMGSCFSRNAELEKV